MKSVFYYFYYQSIRFVNALRQSSTTIQYPEVLRNVPLSARLSLRLDFKECTGCLDCEEACPVNAISFVSKEFTDELVLPESSSGHIFHRRVHKMKVDYSRCVFCGVCVDVCEPRALMLNKNFPPVGSSRSDMNIDLVKTKELPKEKWGRHR